MNRTSWTINVAVDFWRGPKGLIAGRDGRDLFLVSVAWSTEHRLDGLVLTEALGTIAEQAGLTSKAAKVAVPRLLKAVLWETTEAGWLIHDYPQWQLTAAERDRQKTDNAARQARYRASKPPRSNALRNGGGDTLVTGEVTGSSQVKSSQEVLVTSVEPLSSSSRGVWGDDDDQGPLNPRILEALTEVGRRRHRRKADAGKLNGNVQRHEAVCISNAVAELREQAEHHLGANPDASPGQLADLVDPPPRPNGRLSIAEKLGLTQEPQP